MLALALALSAVGTWTAVLSARLIALSKGPAGGGTPPPQAVAELARDGDRFRIEIRGTPGASVVVFADGAPLRMTTLDDKGRGVVSDVRVAPDTPFEIAALAASPEPISPLTPLQPTATVAMIPTASPKPAGDVAVTRGLSPTAVGSEQAPPTMTATPPLREAIRNRPPRAKGSPPVLHLVTDGGPRLAVTFDGNVSSNGTAELLDLLDELNLTITLFVTGGFIERYPMLVRQAVLSGHEVGNHTFSHPHLTTYAVDRRHRLQAVVSKRWFHDQLRRTELAFRRATGRPMAPLWRAPYGEENATLRNWALELGYLHVRWSSLEGRSLDSRDWVADEHSPLYQNSRRMMDRLLGFPRLEGGIVLMHLATERSEPPWKELPRFVEELERRRLTPVRISDLLEASPTWRPWLERARSRHDDEFPVE